MAPVPGYSIEAVRGRITAGLRDELLAFWASHGALRPELARERAEQVVCVLRDPDGAIAAVNSAYVGAVPEIAGKRFYNYRTFAPGDHALGAAREMLAAARDSLAAGFRGDGEEPVGLCWAIGEGERIPGGREPVWADSRMLYAGRDAHGRRLRIGYFEPAVAVEYKLADGYDVRRAGPGDGEAAIALWTREGALDHERATRRVAQISTVGTRADGRLCGVSTAYLEHNRRLGLELWHIRVFVARAERFGNLATHLLLSATDDVRERFRSGADRRAPGAVIEVANAEVANRFPEPIWDPAGFIFVGLGPAGSHTRVRWFDGAELPGDRDPGDRGSYSG